MWIRQIRIGLRSALAFSTLGLLLVLLGLIALYQMNQMDDMSAEVDTNWLPSIMAVNDMSAASSRIRAMTLRYAIVQGDFRGTTLTSLQKAESALETAERRYEPMIASPDERRLYDAYKVARDRYMEQSRLTVSQTQAGNSECAPHRGGKAR